MSIYAFLDNSLLHGLIYGYLALSVYLSLRIFDFPDLTIEGSFPLGAAVAATFIVHLNAPVLGIFLAIIAGFMAGALTAFLHEYIKIGKLLSGIIVAIGLYSISFRIMSAKANLYISSDQNPFTYLSNFNQVFIENLFSIKNQLIIYPVTNIILILLMCVIVYILVIFFRTNAGTVLRFSRLDSRNIITSVGANGKLAMIFSIGIANAFAAFAGVLSLFNDGTASISMGFGVILTGLVALVIGERIVQIWCKDITNIWSMILAPFIGMFVYHILIAAVRSINVYCQMIWGFPNPQDQLQFFNSDIKLLSSLVIVLIYLRRNKNRDNKSVFGTL